MTNSLTNFISSLVAGTVVILIIGIALSIISKNDQVDRKENYISPLEQ